MPIVDGTVDCVSVSENAGFTKIRKPDNTTEVFILWFLSSNIPTTVSSFTRVMHSMWLSMLREAQSTGAEVRVSHPTNSAEVTTLQLGS